MQAAAWKPGQHRTADRLNQAALQVVLSYVVAQRQHLMELCCHEPQLTGVNDAGGCCVRCVVL